MSAIRLVDGTVIFTRNAKFRNSSWYLNNFKFVISGQPSKYVRDEEMGISEDAIDCILHLLKGGKKKKEKINDTSKDRNGSPTPA